jgi:hypothetical protein
MQLFELEGANRMLAVRLGTRGQATVGDMCGTCGTPQADLEETRRRLERGMGDHLCTCARVRAAVADDGGGRVALRRSW